MNPPKSDSCTLSEELKNHLPWFTHLSYLGVVTDSLSLRFYPIQLFTPIDLHWYLPLQSVYQTNRNIIIFCTIKYYQDVLFVSPDSNFLHEMNVLDRNLQNPSRHTFIPFGRHMEQVVLHLSNVSPSRPDICSINTPLCKLLHVYCFAF